MKSYKKDFLVDFNYWVGLPFSKGEHVSPKDRIQYLDTLKEKYLENLMQLQNLEAKIETLENENKKLKEEINNLQNLNAELTEENTELSKVHN